MYCERNYIISLHVKNTFLIVYETIQYVLAFKFEQKNNTYLR